MDILHYAPLHYIMTLVPWGFLLSFVSPGVTAPLAGLVVQLVGLSLIICNLVGTIR